MWPAAGWMAHLTLGGWRGGQLWAETSLNGRTMAADEHKPGVQGAGLPSVPRDLPQASD